MRVYRVLDAFRHEKFPPRKRGEMSIVVVIQESPAQAQRDLYEMLDAVRRLLEADVGRVQRARGPAVETPGGAGRAQAGMPPAAQEAPLTFRVVKTQWADTQCGCSSGGRPATRRSRPRT